MSSFPDEIYFEILLKLPMKSTLVCKSVCKNWNALISDPHFVKLRHNLTIQRTNLSLMISGRTYKNWYTERSRNGIWSLSFDPSSLSSNEFHLYGVEIDTPLGYLDYYTRFMGSCNGFLWLWNEQKQLFCLWNPDSKEYKELPKSPNKPVHQNLFTYCLGYDYTTRDYKLICLYEHSDDSLVYGSVLDGLVNCSLVDVYTMGLNSWETTQVIPYRTYISADSGVLVNGVFHWIGEKIGSSSEVILSLNISNETFKELQPPEITYALGNVGLLKECLCVLTYDANVQVWVMQEYGVQESWTRLYTITDDTIRKEAHLVRCMWCFNSGKILFATDITKLVLYDPEDESARKANIHIYGSDELKYFESCFSST